MHTRKFLRLVFNYVHTGWELSDFREVLGGEQSILISRTQDDIISRTIELESICVTHTHIHTHTYTHTQLISIFNIMARCVDEPMLWQGV